MGSMRCEGCKHYSVELDLHERTGLPVGAKNSCSLNLNPDAPVVCKLYVCLTLPSDRRRYTWTGRRWKRACVERSSGYGPMYPEPEKPWNKDLPWYKRGRR